MRFFKYLLFIYLGMTCAHASTYDMPDHQLWQQKDKDAAKELLETFDTMNPKLSNSVKNESETVRLATFRGWLAQKSFDYYKDAFFAELEQLSIQTGRKIKKEDYTFDGVSSTYAWLDRGYLDTDECRNNYSTRDTCYYPDNFNDIEIIFHIYPGETNTYKIMFIHEESEKDLRTEYSVSLHNHTDLTNPNNTAQTIRLDVSTYTKNWTKYHKWRNQQVSDFRDGMMIEYENDGTWLPGTTKMYGPDMSRDWKSFYMMPGWYVSSRTYDYSNHTINPEPSNTQE